MKIKFGEDSIKVANDKGFETVIPKPNPELFKDLFKITHTTFANYFEECAKCAEKYTNTDQSKK